MTSKQKDAVLLQQQKELTDKISFTSSDIEIKNYLGQVHSISLKRLSLIKGFN